MFGDNLIMMVKMEKLGEIKMVKFNYVAGRGVTFREWVMCSEEHFAAGHVFGSAFRGAAGFDTVLRRRMYCDVAPPPSPNLIMSPAKKNNYVTKFDVTKLCRRMGLLRVLKGVSRRVMCSEERFAACQGLA
jgi:hypothetical protein